MAPRKNLSGRTAGRPSSYTEVIADRICDELMDGKSLVKICASDDMPNRTTVIRWMAANEDFATRCARARVAQADYMDDLILDVALASTAETAQADRVKISAFQWRASKLQPKKYGDKLELEHSGEVKTRVDASALENLTVEQREQLRSIAQTIAGESEGDAEGS